MNEHTVKMAIELVTRLLKYDYLELWIEESVPKFVKVYFLSVTPKPYAGFAFLRTFILDFSISCVFPPIFSSLFSRHSEDHNSMLQYYFT